MDEEELADIPEGTLPVTQDILRTKILKNPQEAWTMLRQNPVAVVALSKIRREVVGSDLENENSIQFFEQYDEKVDNLFDLHGIIDEEGLALTTELINEVWRKSQQDYNFPSPYSVLLGNLEKMIDQSEYLENTPNNRVIREILRYAYHRIQDYQIYEKSKASENWEILEPRFRDMIKSDFAGEPDKNIPEIWRAWFAIASSPVSAAEIYRNEISKLILTEIKGKFPLLTEEVKFQVAPWILSFEKLIGE